MKEPSGTCASGCMSCDIVAGKRSSPGGVIYEDEYWHVDSIVPPVFWRGFLIIKLKRHCEHLAELTPEEAAALECGAEDDHVPPDGALRFQMALQQTYQSQPERLRVNLHSGVGHQVIPTMWQNSLEWFLRH